MHSCSANRAPPAAQTSAARPVDQREFRRALALFPTGVAVVTTLAPDRRKIGVTVNSFTSVSLAPPLISFNLAKSLRSIADWLQADEFAVNLLRHNQASLSDGFAGALSDKWSLAESVAGATSSPILTSNLATFECEKFACYEVGDHFIMIGRVIHFRAENDEEPLVFYRGTYCRVGGRTDPGSGK